MNTKNDQSRFDSLFSVAQKPEVSPESSPIPKINALDESNPLAKSKDPNYQRTTIYLRKDLHRQLKSAAVNHDREISAIVEELVEQWLDIER